jgi:hypothetical protein
MAGLTAAEHRSLELLALGEPSRLPELFELTGQDPIEAAEAKGLISIEDALAGGEVRLAHPLCGEAIRA